MWRKSSSVLAKLLCLWVLLGAYQFWRRVPNSRDSAASHVRSRQPQEWRKVADDSPPNAAGEVADPDYSRERKVLGYRLLESARYDEAVRWSPAVKASSRRLLALANCTPRAVEQFPWDFLTPEQRQNGYIVFHIALAVYMFLALAIVCDRYFVPSLEVLCELLNMETDIAGATFMAAGSSAPELATSVIGVFVAQDDVGLGTVVGSAIYNVMFVISMCALFATSTIHLHWWPMMRDCVAYFLSVVALIVIIADETVQWYEAVTLLGMYVLYVLFMKFNERLEVYFVPRCNVCCRCNTTEVQTETTVLYSKVPSNGAHIENGETTHLTEPRESGDEDDEGSESDDSAEFAPSFKQTTHAHQEAETWHKLCERPEGAGWCLLWALALPLSAAMFLTVPDCRRPSCRKWFWLTFLLSLVWLSAFSFLMVWMITVVGYTANIPDSVMSLTFIAFGVSLPDVVASVLVVRDGLGDMAVSNAIGSNVFDILVCLGVPWLIETSFKNPGSKVMVYSEGLLYSSIMLLSTVIFLLIATHLNRWRLTKKYGVLLLVVYVLYTAFASLYELNIFGYFHPPECSSDY